MVLYGFVMFSVICRQQNDKKLNVGQVFGDIHGQLRDVLLLFGLFGILESEYNTDDTCGHEDCAQMLVFTKMNANRSQYHPTRILCIQASFC